MQKIIQISNSFFVQNNIEINEAKSEAIAWRPHKQEKEEDSIQMEPTESGQSQKTRRKYKVSWSLDKSKKIGKDQYLMMQKRSWQANKHTKI